MHVVFHPRLANKAQKFVLICDILGEVDAAKKAVLPYADGLQTFMKWQKPKWMALVLLFLVFRSYISFQGFFDEHSWCHVAIYVMTLLRASTAFAAR